VGPYNCHEIDMLVLVIIECEVTGNLGIKSIDLNG
jgi:hypothetical protein